MKKIKKGDIVSRNSYQNDILFYVEKIIKTENRGKVAILKGVTIRIEADAPIDDLELPNESRIKENLKRIDKQIEFTNDYIDNRNVIRYGKILHLDGDRSYSEKTEKYYKKRGLNYIVKHVMEFRQPMVVRNLLQRYKPDILVITGHDGMIKNGKNYNDINNYRNSRYFVKSVNEARRWNSDKNELVIFAGACQSYYEAIMSAGANFASSPARILIDFMDPLIVAEDVSITNKNKLIMMSDLEGKIRNGRRAVSGIGAKGKMIVI
ncbi:MAG TPA: sporulation peptidase YabG [Clostridiaceae bacterium]|jgi:spore coat assembly protein|nr:sporulation peptidase YabG [Clostridiaceae bacterium]